MQIIRPPPRPTKSEAVGLGPSGLRFKKHPPSATVGPSAPLRLRAVRVVDFWGLRVVAAATVTRSQAFAHGKPFLSGSLPPAPSRVGSPMIL